MGSHTHVKEAVKNVETHLEGLGLALKKKVSTVLPHEYKPELDISKECNEEEVSQYHQRIGVLRWAVELGRVDICTEVSMMAAHCAMPRKGHLDAVWHVFAYLKRHDKSKMVFDSWSPTFSVKTNKLPRPDCWREIYLFVETDQFIRIYKHCSAASYCCCCCSRSF